MGAITYSSSTFSFIFLRVATSSSEHNEKWLRPQEVLFASKNYARVGPEGQTRLEVLRAVQCRPSILPPGVLDLPMVKQGKYEEKKRRKSPKGRAGGQIFIPFRAVNRPSGVGRQNPILAGRKPLLPGKAVRSTAVGKCH